MADSPDPKGSVGPGGGKNRKKIGCLCPDMSNGVDGVNGPERGCSSLQGKIETIWALVPFFWFLCRFLHVILAFF